MTHFEKLSFSSGGNLQEVPSKLEIQCKKGVNFNLILVGIPSSLIC